MVAPFRTSVIIGNGAETLNCTMSVRLAALGLLIVTVAEELPSCTFVGSTDRVRVAGVEPLVGEIVSQGAFVTETVKESAPPVLPTGTVCEAGGGSPVRYENVVPVVLSVSDGGVVTLAVTMTVCGLFVAPGAVMVMVPVCDGCVRREVFTVILSVPGVLPEAGLMLIQFALEVAV